MSWRAGTAFSISDGCARAAVQVPEGRARNHVVAEFVFPVVRPLGADAPGEGGLGLLGHGCRSVYSLDADQRGNALTVLDPAGSK